VFEIEAFMRKEMKDWMSDVNPKNLAAYIAVLEKLSKKVE
jgi:hypothetical protein